MHKIQGAKDLKPVEDTRIPWWWAQGEQSDVTWCVCSDMKDLLQCPTLMTICEKSHQPKLITQIIGIRTMYLFIHFLPTWHAMNSSLIRNLFVQYPRIALLPDLEHKSMFKHGCGRTANIFPVQKKRGLLIHAKEIYFVVDDIQDKYTSVAELKWDLVCPSDRLIT